MLKSLAQSCPARGPPSSRGDVPPSRRTHCRGRGGVPPSRTFAACAPARRPSRPAARAAPQPSRCTPAGATCTPSSAARSQRQRAPPPPGARRRVRGDRLTSSWGEGAVPAAAAPQPADRRRRLWSTSPPSARAQGTSARWEKGPSCPRASWAHVERTTAPWARRTGPSRGRRVRRG
eukprot:scaffold3767_cov242-Prasinococcus_capsulatus_cf.AAC.5